MDLSINKRHNELTGKHEVSCVGYFRSSFFNLTQLMERQKMIYDLYSTTKDQGKIRELQQLYLITEYMRLELLKSDLQTPVKDNRHE